MDALDESPDGGKFKKESNINMKKKWKEEKKWSQKWMFV